MAPVTHKQQLVSQFQTAQGLNPGYSSHVTNFSSGFMDTLPWNSMYGNIWKNMSNYQQMPLYCNINYNQLYNNGYSNNIWGMNQKAYNSYNNALSSGYNMNTAQNKVGTALTWVNGITAISNSAGTAFDSVVNFGKGIVNTIGGLFK